MTELKDFLDVILNFLNTVWRHNIITVGTSHIQVANILLAFILLILGIKYLKHFTTRIKNYIRHKFHDDKDAASILEKMAHHGIIFIFIILVLEISNIPISSLAFIGGALALGAGLGAQNIINNFISSIILAIEKPLRIGDLVEVEGFIGTVASIGTRCITITTDSNLEVLIPTGKLLQNSFINYSLKDSLIRKYISIEIISIDENDIASESIKKLDCQGIKKILEAILANNQYIPKSPEPVVYLLNINQDSFNYEMSYWHDLASNIPVKQIQDSLSFGFMTAFKKYHIKFAVSYNTETNQTVTSASTDSDGSDIFSS